MARCFCGCGRRVAFSKRTANSYGKTALLAMRRLEEVELDEDDLNAVRFLKEGQVWRSSYARAVHGEVRALADLDYDEWTRWRDTAFAIIRNYDKDAKKIGKAILQSGMTPHEWAESTVAQRLAERHAWAQERGMTDEEALEALEKMDPAERPSFLPPNLNP